MATTADKVDTSRLTLNVKLLPWLGICPVLVISSAYLVPFFAGKGLDISEVLWLQAIFMGCAMLFELFGGRLADRFGRVHAIRMGLLCIGIAHFLYAFGSQYWQFVILEVLYACVSGSDEALLVDSCKATGLEYQTHADRVDFCEYGFKMAGVIVAWGLMWNFGLDAVVIADGLIACLGAGVALMLVEAPYTDETAPSDHSIKLVLNAAWQLVRSSEACWLMTFSVVMVLQAHLSWWLWSPYLQSVRLPVWSLGVVIMLVGSAQLAIVLIDKRKKRLEVKLVAYVLLAGVSFISMASGWIWLLPFILGPSVAFAWQKRPIQDQLNDHIVSEHRATLNSAVGLVRRLTFIVGTLCLGALITGVGLAVAYIVVGLSCMLVALTALRRLHRLGTFRASHERR